MPTESTTVDSSTTTNTSAPAGTATQANDSAPASAESSSQSQSTNAPLFSNTDNSTSANEKSEAEEQEAFQDKLRSEAKRFMGVEEKTDGEQAEGHQEQQGQNSQQQDENQAEAEDDDFDFELKDEDIPVKVDENGNMTVMIPELGEVTPEQLTEVFKAFKYYHSNALKQQQDANAIREAYAQLQQQKAEFEAQKQEYETLKNLKNDPVYKMASLLKGDSYLQQEFSRLVDRIRPGGLKSIQARQNALNRRQQFENMQKQLDDLRKAEEQRNLEAQRQQQEAVMQQQSKAVYDFVDARVKELAEHGINISEQDLKTIADMAVPMIKANGFNPQAVIQHFDNYFRMIANQSQNIIRGYQNAKRSVPPAPPSGGASPTIKPTPIRNGDDFEAMAARFLAKQGIGEN